MDKFYNSSAEEQETQININYNERSTILYTSLKSVYDKYIKRLGNPTKIYYTNNKISGAYWKVPFEDKKRSGYIFSRPTLIGQRK